jgi:murein DD-endopeptidase MepM/ murein hydrolase activator NlpD
MRKNISVILSISVIVFGYLSVKAQTASITTLNQSDLEAQIKQKSDDLTKINQQLQETQQNLDSTRNQNVTLQKELTKLQSNISQLDLGIKSDEITNQKLGLEIQSLSYDIEDIENSITNKKSAIANVLRSLQINDQSNPLIVFLKNRSLSDTVMETQSLVNIRSQLALDIVGLKNFQDELSIKVQKVSYNKSDIELHQKTLAAKKTITQDQQEERKILLVQTKNKESVYVQQVEDLKKQQESVSDEIQKIEEQLRSSFNIGLLPIQRSGVFAWPVQLISDGGVGRITQHQGEVSYLYRGRPHNGLDIGAPIGTPVFATDDGTVIAVDNNDASSWSKYQYGKYVLIKHPNNLATLYAHLSKQAVSNGANVKRGDLIGYVGNTGYSTGPHLHFGVYWAPSIVMKSIPPARGLVPIGVVINPENYL